MESAVVCMDSSQMQNTCDIIKLLKQNPRGPKPAAAEDVSRHEEREHSVTRRKKTLLYTPVNRPL